MKSVLLGRQHAVSLESLHNSLHLQLHCNWMLLAATVSYRAGWSWKMSPRSSKFKWQYDWWHCWSDSDSAGGTGFWCFSSHLIFEGAGPSQIEWILSTIFQAVIRMKVCFPPEVGKAKTDQDDIFALSRRLNLSCTKFNYTSFNAHFCVAAFFFKKELPFRSQMTLKPKAILRRKLIAQA